MERIPLVMVEFRRPVVEQGSSRLFTSNTRPLALIPAAQVVEVGDDWIPVGEFVRLLPAKAKPAPVTEERPVAPVNVRAVDPGATPRRDRKPRSG